ncbi:MAG TPA: hypothetical protein VED63_08210 [Acidimicrobiales bacterium]|nr:hypothetical protein [Acidimicrobiales bacterium]
MAFGAVSAAGAALLLRTWRHRRAVTTGPETSLAATKVPVESVPVESVPVGSVPVGSVRSQREPDRAQSRFRHVIVWVAAAAAIVGWVALLRPHDVGGSVIYWVLTAYGALVLVLSVLVFRPTQGSVEHSPFSARAAPLAVSDSSAKRHPPPGSSFG